MSLGKITQSSPLSWTHWLLVLLAAGLLAGCGGSSGGSSSSTSGSSSSSSGGSSSSSGGIIAPSISGTVSYSGSASTTGWVHVVAVSSTDSDITLSTAVKLVSGSASYTLSGAYALGAYNVSAYLDTVGTNSINAVDPTYQTQVTLTTNGGNISNINLPLADQTAPTPVAPAAAIASPSDQAVLVNWTAVSNNGVLSVTGYKVSWGTDSNASNGGSTVVSADAVFDVVSGLTDGNSYYFKVSSLVGNAESSATVLGPIVVGATTGSNTLQGNITFTGTTNAPLYVILTSESTGISYFVTASSPVSPQSYQIAGIPSGTYTMLSFIDLNGDGQINSGTGELVATTGTADAISIPSTTRVDQLPSTVTTSISTWHQRFAVGDLYGTRLSVIGGTKLPVSGLITAAPSYSYAPYSMGIENDGLETTLDLGSSVPVSGDIYKLAVTYSDGSTDTIQATTGPVLAPTGTPITLGSDRTQPTISWSAPTTLASGPYNYYVDIVDSTGNIVWYSPLLPSTYISTSYAAGTGAALTAGQTYSIWVTVVDANQNEASNIVSYTP